MTKFCGSVLHVTVTPSLLQTPDPRARFAELLRERLPRYQTAADYRINTSSSSIAAVTDEIIALPLTVTRCNRPAFPRFFSPVVNFSIWEKGYECGERIG